MPVTVGVSLKMYFGHRAGREWAAEVADIAAATPAVADGRVELFIAPGYLQLIPALEAVAGTRAVIAAQDATDHDAGPYTGEVSPAELAEVGVGMVELGHAERRRLYGETDGVVARKTAAAIRNGLVPVLCVGEPVRVDPLDALAFAREQVLQAVADAPAGRLVVAYEPVWAIGAPEPAAVEHIRAVCAGLRDLVAEFADRAGSSVIYGGSAGPGLLAELGDDVDGLFLGRFAHDPEALRAVLAEATALADRRRAAVA
ncbi:triose-phosphate isomerase family protein [Homoserinibacter sp. GY 40078]|uniref:triose-phosphate isomerase family protein n=1 Tax=Homoserinibacter sp. GY 40078 TaxID=2603275 RepID=UPI0011C8544F|nr:triose-phosphate isomerase family protein [Homoserinibacter sp. GY 40078]TXK19425.1 triosephosphate isomerase [Homoserinibacter sp. GY 40078]